MDDAEKLMDFIVEHKIFELSPRGGTLATDGARTTVAALLPPGLVATAAAVDELNQGYVVSVTNDATVANTEESSAERAGHLSANHDWIDNALTFQVIPGDAYRFAGVAHLPASATLREL